MTRSNHGKVPTVKLLRAALRGQNDALAAFAGPAGGSVTLLALGAPVAEAKAVVAETPPAAEPVAQEPPVLVASPAK